MKFDDPRAVEQICYEFKLADFPRGQNRARINDLFNGVPPFSTDEVEQNGITVNVNFLEGTRVAHDARSQLYNSFMKPGNYFSARCIYGPAHKRSHWGAVVTKEINQRMKRSLEYFECYRSALALDVLHGVGPSAWDTRDRWCPDPLGIEDVFVPGQTLITMKNLPFFALYRMYTAPQLIKLTRGKKVDKAWNQGVVNPLIEWIDKEATSLAGSNWAEVWAPEKLAERVKGDGGLYASDNVPTINCFDFYYWSDEGDVEGWRRRMIVDSWAVNTATGRVGDNSKLHFVKNNFLYNPEDRVFADTWREVVHFQFADLSAVAPFRYHSVRSLGFLLYATLHLQNRLRGKFNEAVFEALLNYFRVKSMDDAQRALKVELANRGFIDDTLSFVPANERWQVDKELVNLGLMENRRIIDEHAASNIPQQNYSAGGIEKTKFQVMTEVNATSALTGAALNQAYEYQRFQYLEIFRRFCLPNSRDPDVLDFRAACLRQGVPELALQPCYWEIEPERIMGTGNKTIEMAIAQQLMEIRHLYDPDPQRQILRDVTLAITDDPARADQLVPEEKLKITDSVHDAQLASGALMQGLPVAMKTGMNHQEYVETMLINLQLLIARGKQTGKVELESAQGMGNIAAHIEQHVNKISEDPKQKDLATGYGKMLGKLANDVRAFQQQAMEALQKEGGQQGPDPETISKIQNDRILAEAKAENTQQAHAQRTAQRQLQFEQQMAQDKEKFALEMQQMMSEMRMEMEKMRAEFELEKRQMLMDAQLKRQEAKMQSDLKKEQIVAKAEAQPAGGGGNEEE